MNPSVFHTMKILLINTLSSLVSANPDQTGEDRLARARNTATLTTVQSAFRATACLPLASGCAFVRADKEGPQVFELC